jgi:hypothetical protein
VHCIAGRFKDGIGNIGGVNDLAALEIITDNGVQNQTAYYRKSGNGKTNRNQGFPRKRCEHITPPQILVTIQIIVLQLHFMAFIAVFISGDTKGCLAIMTTTA